MTVTITDLHQQLRIDTARMLQYDITALTPAQEVRLSRAAMMRLIIDDLQARQLRGEMIDVKSFVAASEDLERLCGGQPDAPARDDFAGARAELSQFLERRAANIAQRDERLHAEIAAREEQAAIAAALPFEPVAPSGSRGNHSPELPRSNVVPIDGLARANNNLPPLGYLKEGQKRDAFERYYDGRADGPFPWPLPQ